MLVAISSLPHDLAVDNTPDYHRFFGRIPMGFAVRILAAYPSGPSARSGWYCVRLAVDGALGSLAPFPQEARSVGNLTGEVEACLPHSGGT